MFIRRVALGNFMIHRDTEIALSPFTVIVGPNNAGKSALLDGLLNLSAISRDPIPSAFPTGPYSYRSRHFNGDENDEPIRIDVDLADSPDSDDFFNYVVAYRQVSWSGGRAEYEITEELLTRHPRGDVIYDRDRGTVTVTGVDAYLDHQTAFFTALRTAYSRRAATREGTLGEIATGLARFGKYRLDPTLLKNPAPVPDVLPSEVGSRLDPPRMRYQGEGLARVLYFLDRTRDPRLERIIEGLARALDGFVGFDFNAVPVDAVGFSARFDDARGVVEAPNLSAGTLSLIGWLTLLLRDDRQPVLMLEEPEVGLTPRSVRVVYEAARSAAIDDLDRSQVLLTSHSPSLLSWFARDEGMDRPVVMRPQGGTASVETYEEALQREGLELGFDRAMAVETANQVMHGF